MRDLEREIDGEETAVHPVDNDREALGKLSADRYDLAVVDLSLLRPPPDLREVDERGFELLRAIRADPAQVRCGVIVVSGTATTERIHRALQTFRVFRVVPKNELEEHTNARAYLRDLARQAVLAGRLQGAEAVRKARHTLTLSFSMRGWTRTQLQGSDGKFPDSHLRSAAPFVAGEAVQRAVLPGEAAAAELVRRADAINRLLVEDRDQPAGRWYQEMQEIGGTLTEGVAAVADFAAKWAYTQTLPREDSDLWLRFRGPAEGLALPFDLMRDERDELCRRHLLSREVGWRGFAPKLRTFAELIAGLQQEKRPLRALLVGANTDGTLPAAEEEVETLAEQISLDLRRMGLAFEPTALCGEEASYTRVEEELRSGRYHLFHYAGHGRYDDDRPARSGPLLPDGEGVQALTADDLRQLPHPALQLVFLSCCLGAVDKNDMGAGPFCHFLQDLAKANVPAAITYRWLVYDDAALSFASTFYAHLWRTLCPGEATLAARNETRRVFGHDDPTWAAPVLLMQGG